MKMCLPILKISFVLLVFLLTTLMVDAQTRTATVSGNWNNTATWGGALVPTSANDVVINNGVTVTVNVAAACLSLTVNSGDVPASVSIGSNSLAVTGAIAMGAPTDATSNRSITVGTGSLTCGSIIMSDVAAVATSDDIITASSGSITVTGDITMNGAANENLIDLTTTGGTLNIGGAISLNIANGTLDATASGSKVNYNGANQTVRPQGYRNLLLSGSGIKTLTGLGNITDDLTVSGTALAATEAALTIGGDLVIGAGASFTIGGFNTTITGLTNVSGTLTHSSAAGTKTHTGNVTIYSGGTWNDNDDVIAILFSGNFQNDGTLNAGTGVHSFSGSSKSFSGVVSIPNITTTTGRTNNGTLTVSTALSLGATLTQGANAILNIGGTISGAGALTATANPNTVNYTSSGQTVKVATYHHLNFTGSGTVTAGGIISINGNLTIGSGVTFDGSTFAHILKGNWINNGGVFISTGTVTFDGTIQSIGGTTSITFNNLTIDGPGTTTLALDIAVAGNLNVTSGDVLDLSTFTANRTAIGGTLTVAGTLKVGGLSGGRTGSNFPLDFATNTLSGTVNYNHATGGQTIFATTYSTLTLGNTSGTQTVGGNISTSTINNNTNATNILDMGSYTLAATAINNTGTVKTQNTSATPLPTGETWGGIVEYDGASQTLRAGTYNNLILSGSGSKTIESSLTVNGNITISNGVTLVAPILGADDIVLKGNWINDGMFTGGNDLVTFSGTTAQTIGGTSSTNFVSLRINNAAGVTLNQPATVSTNLTLTSGLLTSGVSKMLTLNNGISLSGVSNVSFVNGPVTKIGNEAFIFPIGKSGTGYQACSISAPGAITDAFTAEYIRASGADLGPITAPGLLWVSNCEYWTLNRTTGASNVNVTLNWNTNSGCGGGAYVTTFTGLQVSYFDGVSWSSSAVNATSGTTTTGTITRNALTTYRIFTIGNTNAAGNPLPVMFADVKAFEKNTGVQIEWSNLTERDLIKYVVERSANGVNFTAISQQLPRSNQNDKENYSAFDATPFAGANYYRIKVLEISGKIIYSKILKVEIGKTKSGFTLYPNPVTGNQVTVGINAKQGQYTIKVLNTAGQNVYSQGITHLGGSMARTIELPFTVKPGVYNMQISGDNYSGSKMFIVQ